MRNLLLFVLLAAAAASGCDHTLVEAEFHRVTFANASNRLVQILNERGEPFAIRLRDGTLSAVIPPGSVGQTTFEAVIKNNCLNDLYWQDCQYQTTTVVYAVPLADDPLASRSLSTPCILGLREGELSAFEIREKLHPWAWEDPDALECGVIVGRRY